MLSLFDKLKRVLGSKNLLKGLPKGPSEVFEVSEAGNEVTVAAAAVLVLFGVQVESAVGISNSDDGSGPAFKRFGPKLTNS